MDQHRIIPPDHPEATPEDFKPWIDHLVRDFQRPPATDGQLAGLALLAAALGFASLLTGVILFILHGV